MNRAPTARGSGFLYVFGVPMILAALSVFGVVSALLGDGVWDVLSWITLSIPVAVIVRHVWFAGSSNGNIGGREKRRL